MQEVLSQGEIDSLLAALTSGELSLEEAKKPPAPAVKSYDFRRPNKFSKEHLRTLEMLHQHFARLLSSFLSGYLRAAANVELASVGQMIYEEFIRSIPSPTALAVFSLNPLEGSALMEINAQVVFPMLDLLFGGPGTSTDQMRELTEIEVTVVKRLVERILEHLAQAWHDFYSVEPEVQAIETNPRMQQLYSPNEVVALITFAVSINEEERGFINLCLPYILMEPVISRLSVRQQFSRQVGAPRPEDMERLGYWLGFSRVELQVILGETEITVHELLQLQEGDVLVLNRHLNQDLDLYVEGERKFGVQAGRVGQNLAVQVVSLNGEEMNGAG
ncbi:flagellar motor switch protein FliM [Desulfofundulus sp. TPOSR]|uniref:flagellar motor switch protein FliM n=1 Tax=Desulfofundulus sp. TPOSR TaxID=2714340 RepID=UPI00140E0CA9|nr:flagellar motor switch protein FliM [Desulfofundulus sp. TPOSR]NHM28233.1 flagellar motor switch protein FliM [Desulfofundulus sp. TPOSR]